MTKRDIFVVASKIFGIYLLVRSIESLRSIGYFLVATLTMGPQGRWFFLGDLLPLMFYIGGSFCLIKWAEPIAAVLAGKEEAPEVKAVVGKDSLQQIAFSAVGVFIIAAALPQLTRMVATLTVQLSDQARLRTWVASVGIVLQLGIGIFLFFGSKGLVGLLKKIKSI